MRIDKEKAIYLRIEGKSYTEISRYLNIPKSTLSYWLRNIKMDSIKKQALEKRASKAGLKALLARNKLQTQEAKIRADKIMGTSICEIETIDMINLRLIGSALYFAEGGKTKNRADFTNSNSEMIKIMMNFFRKVCKVSKNKFRVQLSIHNREEEMAIKKYWSKITGIPISQFIKTNFAISKYSKKRRKNKLPFGTIQIRIADVNLFHKIQGWIQGITKQIDSMPG